MGECSILFKAKEPVKLTGSFIYYSDDRLESESSRNGPRSSKS
jgi:hypothetical protein